MIQKFIEVPNYPTIREPVPYGSFAYDTLYSMAEEYGFAQLVWYSLNGTRVVEGEYSAS
jgi:hypothetical protein